MLKHRHFVNTQIFSLMLMQFNLDITTLNVNNSDKGNTEFKKYEIDVSLNELNNNENECQLKYGYMFMTSPKGVSVSVEGTIDIKGNSSEIESMYKKDEQNIPNILRLSYHELYPVLFMITKSMKIPCPPYEISKTMQKAQESSEVITEDAIESMPEETNESDVDTPNKEHDYEKFQSMSIEELTQLQTELNKQNSDNPSEELQNRLKILNDVLNDKNNISTVSPNNVS